MKKIELMPYMKVDIDKIRIPECWKNVLYNEFNKSYFGEIKHQYIESIKNGATIYPQASDIFNAFVYTPFSSVRVVLLGQDPYHGVGQAMGLSFSVRKGVAMPASLKVMFKELERSLGIRCANHGDLTLWARQGVMLLNASLTVEANKPNSHKHWGWNYFTDTVIKTISDQKEHCIFLLWGGFAKAKKQLINVRKHSILESVHPSPLAGNGFSGNGHFKKVNEIFASRGEPPIDWDIMKD